MQYQDAIRFLNIEYPVTQDSVKSAYRRLVKQYHPDAGGSDELFKKLTQAYKVALQGPEYDYKETCRETYNDDYHSYSHFKVDSTYIMAGSILLAVLAFVTVLEFRYDYYLAFSRFCQTVQPYLFIMLAGIVCLLLFSRRIGAGVVICIIFLTMGYFAYQETVPIFSQHIQNIDNIVSTMNYYSNSF